MPAPGELTKLTQIEHVRHEALAVVDEADGSFVAEARYVELNDEPGDQRRWIRADRVQRAVQ